MSIICLYMYHYICMYGRSHCNQGLLSLKTATSNKEGEACYVKKKKVYVRWEGTQTSLY